MKFSLVAYARMTPLHRKDPETKSIRFKYVEYDAYCKNVRSTELKTRLCLPVTVVYQEVTCAHTGVLQRTFEAQNPWRCSTVLVSSFSACDIEGVECPSLCSSLPPLEQSKGSQVEVSPPHSGAGERIVTTQ